MPHFHFLPYLDIPFCRYSRSAATSLIHATLYPYMRSATDPAIPPTRNGVYRPNLPAGNFMPYTAPEIVPPTQN